MNKKYHQSISSTKQKTFDVNIQVTLNQPIVDVTASNVQRTKEKDTKTLHRKLKLESNDTRTFYNNWFFL